MTAEATLYRDSSPETVTWQATEAYSAGQVVQVPDGRVGVIAGLQAIAAGEVAVAYVAGQFTLAKTSGVVILKGGKVFWDRSANAATPLRAAAGADFYAGVAMEDAASTATTVVVDLNVLPHYLFDFHRDPCDTTIVKTAGSPSLNMRGGDAYMAFDTTAEAQKVDILSGLSVPVDVPCILEGEFRIGTAADADVADFNIGLANATHASDADSITESVFFHNDSGADLNLDAESDDGTTEVAATDTGEDLVAGTRVFVQIDARDKSDIKLYVNGVRVLSTTTFTLAAATGPLKALAHWEKTANDSPGEVRISSLTIRAADMAA